MAPPSFLRNGIGLDAARQAEALDELQTLGIVEVRHLGPRALRHVRLDLHRLREVVEERLVDG
jgi:hypothetical protein